MNEVVGELKEKERFGEIAPVAIPPKLRIELELEREEILERMQVGAATECSSPAWQTL